MENASKALLIGGGILIAMLVISIGVYLFVNYRDVGTSYEQNMEATEIQKFNSNFTGFERREDITIQEIVTLANFAKQYKEQTGISVTVGIIGISNDLTGENDMIEIIKNNQYEEDDKPKRFKQKNIEYDKGMVNSITFSQSD